MRTVPCEGIGPVSALGFGCASLGSRVSPKRGRVAIERALRAGVTWFDVAPSYGDGKAEEILGAALRGVDVAIATKVGLVAPPAHPLKRAVAAIARPLIAAIPALRPLAKRLRPAAAERLPLDAETIRVSVFRSLERLGVDSVAMLALHDPSLEDIANEDVARAVADIRDQGLAARTAIAGAAEICTAAAAQGFPFDIAQVANSPFDRGLRAAAAAAPFTITHSVFGVTGALSKLREMMKNDAAFHTAIAALGYEDPAALLMAYAFAANPNGVVIASGYAAGHLAANAALASRPPDPGLVAAVDRLVAASGASGGQGG
ncbi:MAG: aldo/keto reductase [Alphaproteobacteria bacterium]|nr:aldo/keto reductase [Alphaproteobacteria bacterium]